MDVANPISPSVKALVELFKNELSTVAFPGVDIAILEQLISDVQTYTDAVTKAEAALEAARTSLRETEETLTVKSQKALAYAKVYAEDKPEIAAKIDFVARIAGTSTPATSTRERDRDPSDGPKRRGRPSKKAASAEAADATPAPSGVVEAASDMTPMAPSVIELGASATVADATPSDPETAALPE